MRRRTTGSITQQKPYESIPMNKGLYEEAQDLSKGIYRVTIKASVRMDWRFFFTGFSVALTRHPIDPASTGQGGEQGGGGDG